LGICHKNIHFHLLEKHTGLADELDVDFNFSFFTSHFFIGFFGIS